MASNRTLPVVAPDFSNPESVKAPPPSRPCGTCNMCCLVFAVESHHITKPNDKWCPACTIGSERGCGVYGTPDRPEECGAFYCLWTQGIGPADGRPDRVKAVMKPTPDGKSLQIHPHPMMPDAWRNTWVADVVRKAQRAGITVFVITGEKRLMIRHGIGHNIPKEQIDV